MNDEGRGEHRDGHGNGGRTEEYAQCDETAGYELAGDSEGRGKLGEPETLARDVPTKLLKSGELSPPMGKGQHQAKPKAQNEQADVDTMGLKEALRTL